MAVSLTTAKKYTKLNRKQKYKKFKGESKTVAIFVIVIKLHFRKDEIKNILMHQNTLIAEVSVLMK